MLLETFLGVVVMLAFRYAGETGVLETWFELFLGMCEDLGELGRQAGDEDLDGWLGCILQDHDLEAKLGEVVSNDRDRTE